ncbi:hypothetical protein B0H16DRAFT_1454558 [Mycena metata]|uniref:Uncharacterized protein n=1 Tax=Mycena metata TaxID=1033252 RepID=A0AAD7JIP4_9AGAR|nr:hypothetical protein B0H16DRAFT_1454558 [Mycena metata]
MYDPDVVRMDPQELPWTEGSFHQYKSTSDIDYASLPLPEPGVPPVDRSTRDRSVSSDRACSDDVDMEDPPAPHLTPASSFPPDAPTDREITPASQVQNHLNTEDTRETTPSDIVAPAGNHALLHDTPILDGEVEIEPDGDVEMMPVPSSTASTAIAPKPQATSEQMLSKKLQQLHLTPKNSLADLLSAAKDYAKNSGRYPMPLPFAANAMREPGVEKTVAGLQEEVAGWERNMGHTRSPGTKQGQRKCKVHYPGAVQIFVTANGAPMRSTLSGFAALGDLFPRISSWTQSLEFR